MIHTSRSKSLIVVLAFAGIAAATSASKNEESNDVRGEIYDLDGNIMRLPVGKNSFDENEPDMDVKLISYEPMLNSIKFPKIEANMGDLQKARNLERESSQVVPQKASPKLIIMDQKKAPAPSMPVMESKDSAETSSQAREETIKLIAHNSREVRLMGPEEKEVEMKDDAATKMAVALDNLKKEAGEVWGQVNTKLDKGWTDFKAMVEDAVDQAKRKSSKSSALDDIVAGADTTVKTIKDQAEIASTKIKGFFNNLGVNV